MNNKNTRPWILVVEDDEAVRILLSCIIKKLDCNVSLATSGKLSDLKFPFMTN